MPYGASQAGMAVPQRKQKSRPQTANRSLNTASVQFEVRNTLYNNQKIWIGVLWGLIGMVKAGLTIVDRHLLTLRTRRSPS